MKENLETRAQVDVKVHLETDGKQTIAKVDEGEVRIVAGQKVAYHNATGEKIVVMFPVPWFGDRIFEVDAAQSRALLSKTQQNHAHTGRLIPYQIYCHANGDYAVGGSPPKMKVDPPPDDI